MEYDPEYMELHKLANGVPAQQVGDEVIAAVEPDWVGLRKGATEVLKRSKDLRAAVYLDEALLKTEGLTGLRDGLQVLKGLVELYWDVLHPKLDPDDNNDPTERMNVLRAFASFGAGIEAESVMVAALRDAPLTNSRTAGRFGLKQIAIAGGELTVELSEGETRPTANLITAAARDTDPEFLQASRAAAEESVNLAKELESLVDGKVGAGRGVDFKDFVRNLQAAMKHLDRFLSLHGIGSGAPLDDADGAAASDGGGGGGDGAAVRGGGGPAISGEIRSTGDVIRVLEKICDFYERTEPSSPIPLLIRRAQRLVGKNFWEVLQELSPEAITAVKVISGADPKLPES
jgi:type VI secretion system protein ImpA